MPNALLWTLYNYHWRELPQVSFLSWQTHVCHDKHVFITTKHIFCHNKSVLVTKTFVATKLCLSWQIFVMTTNFDKRCILSGQTCMLVTTKLLSRQNYVCPNKYLLWQKLCQDKNILSQQTSFWYLWQLPPMIYNCTFFNQSAQWNKFPLNIHIGEVGILGLLLLMPLLHHL